MFHRSLCKDFLSIDSIKDIVHGIVMCMCICTHILCVCVYVHISYVYVYIRYYGYQIRMDRMEGCL